MIPTWMTEELERERREREWQRRERPQLRIELPVREDDEPGPTPGSAEPVVIEFGRARVAGTIRFSWRAPWVPSPSRRARVGVRGRGGARRSE